MVDFKEIKLDGDKSESKPAAKAKSADKPATSFSSTKLFRAKIDAIRKAKAEAAKNPGAVKVAATTAPVRVASTSQVLDKGHSNGESWGNILSYWFPIAIVVALIAFAGYHFLGKSSNTSEVAMEGDNVSAVSQTIVPTFDMVRTEPGGGLVVAGRFLPKQLVQIEVNKKVIGSETCDANGEFAFSTSKKFKPGNYIIRLLNNDKKIASRDSVFVYVASEKKESSLSLLMTADGSKFLQAPANAEGQLTISKIDYLANNMVRLSGHGLPRLNVAASINGNVVGAAKVGDSRNWGIDADFSDFRAGQDYAVEVKMTDDIGNVVDVAKHKFNLPESKPGDEAYYTVRRGDCLWIISRHQYGRGVLYTAIFDANNNKIKNPHWIYPKQVFVIPTKNK